MVDRTQNIGLAAQLTEQLFKTLGISLQAETPMRFVKMINELTAYQNITNQEIACTVNKLFDIDENSASHNMIVVKDIDAFSLCEHHIALMYDMKVAVAYVPEGKVLGLSKIVRMVDMVCKRLQLQERIGEDIVDVMKMLISSKNVAVHIKAKHGCVAARGVRNVSSVTETTNFSGEFLENIAMQKAFIRDIS